MYDAIGKRVVDFALAFVALVVAAPLLALTALAIKFEDRGPVIFRQRRIGRNGVSFEFLKFRSMPVDAAEMESAEADDLPVTRTGRIIRRFSIDELPQLINVLRGEMSLVGPRPALASQTDLIELREVNGSWHLRPGLTGLAQIEAFDGMTAAEKAKWDGRYAASVSLRTDLAIMARTFRYLASPPPTY